MRRTELPRPSLLPGEEGFDLRVLEADGLSIKALPGGSIYSIERRGILINQVLSSALLGGLGRCYARVATSGPKWRVLPLVGPESASDFSWRQDRFVWSGIRDHLAYAVTLWIHPSGETWFTDVRLTNRGAKPVRCDAVFLQDLALATRGQARNNELYTSQYLDHVAHPSPEFGTVVMTRQNLAQPGPTHPWIVQGCLQSTRGITTDGFDFFGVGHRAGQAPAALGREVIGDRIRQYEVAMVGLQSGAVELACEETCSFTFFAHYVEHHPEPSSRDDLSRLERVKEHARGLRQALDSQHGSFTRDVTNKSRFHVSEGFAAQGMSEDDLKRLFPGRRRHEERVSGTLHSFFYGEGSDHVVLRAKELSVARPHGHIMRSGQGMMPDDETLSSAFYASGVFASQMALGNSSLAKLIAPVRDPLNVIRSSGLRILVRERNGEWVQLLTPSAFEMSASRCRWIYVRGPVRLTVTCWAFATDPAMTYALEATGGEVEWMVCGEVAVGAVEYEQAVQRAIDTDRGRIGFTPAAGTLLKRRQPRISFWVVTPDVERVRVIGGEEVISTAAESTDAVSVDWPCFVIRTRATDRFQFTVLGTIDDPLRAQRLCDRYERPHEAAEESISEARFWRRSQADAYITGDDELRLSQLQDTLNWFARDATIHLSAPRGLEQANGAAWGVRDVCQGPVEYLLSYDDCATVAAILRRLFAQQYARRNDWPQWFMFPPFQDIRSAHCHGDVIIWPLKALCDYLEASDDGDFLNERLPYADDETSQETEHQETVLEHVDRLISKVTSQFLRGTSLLMFGDGDWDDSLQPADPALREKMVSSWTNALLYQTLSRWAVALDRFGEASRAVAVRELAASISSDFQAHLIHEGVLAGFAIYDNGSKRPSEYLLHPTDRRTGLKYRLIPMTRSILAGLFTPEQAHAHLQLIREHLLFPDGARLMDRPTAYDGGRERVFRRAESASFFGREIGLQYLHAHLRYAEALAQLGEGEAMLHALMVANPIAVTDVVPNARARQRNTYFSSSDAAFADRHQASRDYARLKAGEIAVDGGWRLYSSGPGIYTNLVIRHLLGVRRHYDHVEIDRVLPAELGAVECQMLLAGKSVRCIIERWGSDIGLTVNGKSVTNTRAEGRYRVGGLRVPISALGLAEQVEIRVR